MTVYEAAVRIFIDTGQEPKECARLACELREAVLDAAHYESEEAEKVLQNGMSILSLSLDDDDDGEFNADGTPRHE